MCVLIDATLRGFKMVDGDYGFGAVRNAPARAALRRFAAGGGSAQSTNRFILGNCGRCRPAMRTEAARTPGAPLVFLLS